MTRTPKRLARHLGLALAAAWFCAGTVRAADSPAALPVFKVYPLAFADGAAVTQALVQVLGTPVTCILEPRRNQLLIGAPEAQHATIAGLIRQLDIPPQNVRITVGFHETVQREQFGASVEGGGVVRTDLAPGRYRLRVQPRVENVLMQGRSDTVQSLLVASGHEGFISVGEQVPYLEWLMDYGLQFGYLEQRVAWQEVGARLWVQPTVIGSGPLVRIRVVPELSGFADGRSCRIRYNRVSTEIVAQDGQTVSLGGLARDETFYSRFLVGFDSQQRVQPLSITITPHIESPAR